MAMRPVPESYPVTQTFYANATKYNLGAGHGAIDYGAPVGTPVVAPEDGTVVFADWAWKLPGGANDWASRWYQIKPAVNQRKVGGGIMTVIRTDIGSIWILAHLSDNNIAPKGTRVRKGQRVALTGHTGSSTGPHLHMSLLPPTPNYSNGYFGAINPAPWMTEPYAELKGPGSAEKKAAAASSVRDALPVYSYEVKPSAAYTPAASVPAVYGQKRTIKGVTIHWWDYPSRAGTHDGTVNYLRRKGANTSAHYVVSPGRVTLIVDPKHAAWHAGSAKGNATTIGIECNPHDIAGTLPTLAALIRDLEKAYGSLLVFQHKQWKSTTCAGDYGPRLPEIVNLVNDGAPSAPKKQAVSSAPKKKSALSAPKEWSDMATKKEIEESMERVVTRVMKGEGARQMRGSIKHMLSPRTDDGKGVLSGIFAFAGDRGIKPRGGVVTGNMTAREDEEWGRHFRATTASSVETLEDNQERLETKLDALAEALYTNGLLETTTNKKEKA